MLLAFRGVGLPASAEAYLARGGEMHNYIVQMTAGSHDHTLNRA